MSLKIARESPVSSDGRALIDGSEAAIRSVLDQDECFTFTADELDRPDIDFFVARLRNKPIGCVALCHYAAYAEIKRLFVTPAARGTGTARALMHYFEAEARNAAHTIIRLRNRPGPRRRRRPLPIPSATKTATPSATTPLTRPAISWKRISDNRTIDMHLCSKNNFAEGPRPCQMHRL